MAQLGRRASGSPPTQLPSILFLSKDSDAKKVSARIGLGHGCPTHSGMTPALNPGHFETTAGSIFKCSDTISAGECLSHSDKENSSNRDVRKTAKNCMSVSPTFCT